MEGAVAYVDQVNRASRGTHVLSGPVAPLRKKECLFSDIDTRRGAGEEDEAGVLTFGMGRMGTAEDVCGRRWRACRHP